MESRLYEAALEGNVTTLLELLQQDPLILDRVVTNCLSETPLHVAALLGHLDFVNGILHCKPELARELDSRQSSPLHIASVKGYVDIVRALLQVNPEMCLSRDVEGRNPLHLAAMKGRTDVLRELVRARPHAVYATTIWGETLLHLCVKHNQLEALNLLLGINSADPDFWNAKDDYGMTALHLAVADKQIKVSLLSFQLHKGIPSPDAERTINILLTNTRVEVNALNTNGYTALDILAQSRRDAKDLDILDSLRGARAFKAAEIHSSVNRIGNMSTRGVPTVSQEPFRISPLQYRNPPKIIKKENWLTRKRDALMVVASLIATMAFQAGLNPPGGLWQNDPAGSSQDQNNNTSNVHQSGTSVMAYKNSVEYSQYLAYNTTGFITSLSIILLLVTGLPYKRRFFMRVLVVIVWIAITSIALTYRVSIHFFTPKQDERKVNHVIERGVQVWCGVVALLLLLHSTNVAKNLFKKIKNLVGRRRRPSPLLPLNNTNV